MSSYHIIDSNVIAIANGLQTDASLQCEQNAIYFLQQIQEIADKNECILIYDDRFVILNECQRHCTNATKKRLGNVFLKWIHNNKNNPDKCKLQNLPIDIETNDELLPPCFDGFDRNDRKYLFLALAFKQSNPNLHYGIDRGYQKYSHCFIEENIELSRLCD